jgi:hypothetical protein
MIDSTKIFAQINSIDFGHEVIGRIATPCRAVAGRLRENSRQLARATLIKSPAGVAPVLSRARSDSPLPWPMTTIRSTSSSAARRSTRFYSRPWTRLFHRLRRARSSCAVRRRVLASGNSRAAGHQPDFIAWIRQPGAGKLKRRISMTIPATQAARKRLAQLQTALINFGSPVILAAPGCTTVRLNPDLDNGVAIDTTTPRGAAAQRNPMVLGRIGLTPRAIRNVRGDSSDLFKVRTAVKWPPNGFRQIPRPTSHGLWGYVDRLRSGRIDSAALADVTHLLPGGLLPCATEAPASPRRQPSRIPHAISLRASFTRYPNIET